VREYSKVEKKDLSFIGAFLSTIRAKFYVNFFISSKVDNKAVILL